MNRDYITKFDKWFKNIDNKSDKLILTSDIDSLASCYLLNLLFSCEVKGFYDFSRIYFVDIVQGHDKEHFYKIIRKYKLHEQIYIDNEGYLHTDIDLKGLSKLFNINLKLPTEQFYKYRELKNVGVDLNKINSKSLNKKKIFSSALVRKNFLKMSIV
jgi:hypothetical protein